MPIPEYYKNIRRASFNSGGDCDSFALRQETGSLCSYVEFMMKATPRLLAKGFIGRSIDEFKRLSEIGQSLNPQI